MSLGPSIDGPITLTPAVRRVPATLPRLPLDTLEIEPEDIVESHPLPPRPIARGRPSLAVVLPRPTLLALLTGLSYLGIGIGIGVAVGLVGLGLVRLVW